MDEYPFHANPWKRFFPLTNVKWAMIYEQYIHPALFRREYPLPCHTISSHIFFTDNISHSAKETLPNTTPPPPNKMSIIPAKTTLLFARLEQFHFFLVLISWSFSGLFCFNVLQLTLPQGISFYFYFFYEVHNFHWSPFFPSCN